MEGDLFYQKVKELTVELLNLCADYECDEYEKEQFIKSIPIDQRIINFPGITPQKNEINQTFLEFTEKEIAKMPKEFKNDFKIGKIKAHIRKKENGSYEIRVMIKGKRITSADKNLKSAKQKFIEKLYNPDKWVREQHKRKVNNFSDYALKWLDVAKKPYIKENTYKEYLKSIKLDILPKFGNKNMQDISAFEIQEHINAYTLQGKNRTAKKIYQLMNALFEYAVADGIIDRSPTKKVIIGNYEQSHGTALTRQEEKQIIDDLLAMPTSRYRQAFVFIMYTGLRRSELASTQINGEWITVVTAKQRKGKKEKARRIPVSPMLKKVLPLIDINLIKQTNPNKLTCAFKELYPNHHLHELRHTFITRCQECGIAREIVSIWAGHSTDKTITTTVYTHLDQNLDLQLKEIAHFIYDFE